MALDPMEWIVIGVIVLVIFIWGPQKIPEMARSIGRAKKEFEAATKEFQQVANEFKNPTDFIEKAFSEPAGAQTPKPAAAQTEASQPTSDQAIIENAKKLGITTDGKTKDQISEEILAKSKGAA